MQLRGLLTLSKCMTGFYDYDLNPYICLRNCSRELRSSIEVRFDYRKPRKPEYEQNFFYRASALVNRLPRIIDITNRTGLKQRLLRVLWSFFKKKSKELVNATWRM